MIAVLASNKSHFNDFIYHVEPGDRDKFKCVLCTKDLRCLLFSEVITVGVHVNNNTYRELRVNAYRRLRT